MRAGIHERRSCRVRDVRYVGRYDEVGVDLCEGRVRVIVLEGHLREIPGAERPVGRQPTLYADVGAVAPRVTLECRARKFRPLRNSERREGYWLATDGEWQLLHRQVELVHLRQLNALSTELLRVLILERNDPSRWNRRRSWAYRR